jgi:hypothetical protein
MFNMFSKHPLQKKRDINPIYDNVFKKHPFQKKVMLTQSIYCNKCLKTFTSKESDVNPIYLLQHMFKNIQLKKKSDVNTIYHNIFKNVHFKRKVRLTQSTLMYLNSIASYT